MSVTRTNIAGFVLTAISILATGVMPTRVQAASITFVFDCQSSIHSPSVCTPGGPFGTLTLSDSVVDPNRVDIDVNLIPTFGDTLEKVYLNWALPFLTNHKFYLINQSAAPGVASNNPYPGEQLGTVSYGDGTYGLGKFKFDISVNYPSGTPFTFGASLALYNQLPSPDVPVNLDISNFMAASGGTGTPSLYAGYRTHNDTDGRSGEFWAGSTSLPEVPEPASLLLLGTGLIGVAGFAARRRAAAKRRASKASSGG